MAQIVKTIQYKCDNDCEIEGCPKHIATLKFNSVSNIYHFDDGQGQRISFDLSLAESMISMFREYDKERADTIKV